MVFFQTQNKNELNAKISLMYVVRCVSTETHRQYFPEVQHDS